MSRVALHGELKEQFGPEFNLSVSTPGEAVRALCCMVPNFKQTLEKGSYFIFIEDDEHVNIDEENFHLSTSGTINIMPEIVGAKRGGLGKALMGIAMIGLSVFTAGAAVPFIVSAAGSSGMSFMAAATLHGLVTSTLMNVGIALALGGATQLLSPKVKNDGSSADREASGILGGQESTLANGACVPVVYGEVLAQGVPVSFEISDATTNYVTGDIGYNESVGGYNQIAVQIREFYFP